MVIAVNTRLLLKNKLEGIGWFSYETLKRMVLAHPEHQFIFIFDRKPDPEFIFAPNVTPVVAFPPARHPILWFLFFETGIPRVLRKYKPDLFISPDGWLSLRTKVKSICVIHDLNFEEYPQFLPWHIKKYYHFFFPRFARKAKRIATVSEYTKQDIAKRYKVPLENIDVVYNGSNAQYKPIATEAIEKIRGKYCKGQPFFLFIGLIHPRKNITNLLLAYEAFRRQSDEKVSLLIVGSKHWWTKDMDEAYSQHKYRDDIIFSGRMQVEELQQVIPSALALVYISFFEGFGIPVVESMYCDIPVIASRVTSIPEVGGDAALYVDPFSVDSIAVAMKKIAETPELRRELIEKGRVQRSKFSWDNTAKAFWQCIEKVIHQ